MTGGFERSFVAPRLDCRVISAQEDIGNFPAIVVGGAGIMGVVKQAMGEGVLLCGVLITEHSGKKAHDGIGDHQCGQHATGQHIVTDGNFIIDQMVCHALVDTLVVATEKNEVTFSREVPRRGIGKLSTLRGHKDDLGGWRSQIREGAGNGIDLHHHSRSTAVGRIIDCAVRVARPLAQVDRLEVGEAFVARAFEDARLEHATADLGENSENLNFQVLLRLQVGNLIKMR